MVGSLSAQTQLVKDLKKGEDRTLVIYGTSIAKMGNGPVWVKEISDKMNKKYGNHLKVHNKGGSGRNSQWATMNIQDSVLIYNPDAIIIEFSVNDAVKRFDISPEQSVKNTQYLIDQIKKQNSKAEILLLIVSSNPLGEAKEKREDVALYNQKYREMAKSNKLQLIDFTPVWNKMIKEKGEKEMRRYVHDGIHSTRKGALEIIAPKIIKSLETAK